MVKAPIPVRMFITERLGIVHCDEYCPDHTLDVEIPVTRNQCLVYKLPPCTECWKDAHTYDAYIQGSFTFG